MKTLKLFLVSAGLLVAPFTIAAQQPVNESQVQADALREDPSPQPRADSGPPVHLLHFNSKRDVITASIRVLPGQKLKIGNDVFFWIRIFSDHPFSIDVGQGCLTTSTTDITCEILPNRTIEIQDVRVPNDSTPSARMYITALRHTP
jgi:hypothetical protein